MPVFTFLTFACRLSFAACYGLEVAAIVAVLKQFPDDTRKAVGALLPLRCFAPAIIVPSLVTRHRFALQLSIPAC